MVGGLFDYLSPRWMVASRDTQEARSRCGIRARRAGEGIAMKMCPHYVGAGDWGDRGAGFSPLGVGWSPVSAPLVWALRGACSAGGRCDLIGDFIVFSSNPGKGSKLLN